VTAVDASRVGLEKAQRLAAERGVTITTVHSDLRVSQKSRNVGRMKRSASCDSKLSMESYKERKANYSLTLTGLGKWWGRKPLILVRADNWTSMSWKPPKAGARACRLVGLFGVQ